MTLLSRAITSLVVRAPTISRVPMTTNAGGYAFGVAGAVDHVAEMMTYSQVGWLFAVVSRIASTVAAVEWKLYRKARERVEIEAHPALSLWRDASPFLTGHQFIEGFQQHEELTGEAWLLVLKNRMGLPVELMALRPDRVEPIPHPTEFISGYWYKIGGQKFMLAPDEIVPILMPNPMNPYRGAGPVQALLPELDAEHMSVLWSRAFFRNSARPGGIVEVDRTLSDPEFERMRAHWNAQHSGISNAHRVAFLERAKWVDVSMSQRDMQYEQLRKLTRDNILGAYGVPLSVMGITESVNRANAEAGDVMFARWVIKPRLIRIRAALNERLLPMFGEGMEFDFVDPVPEDHAALLLEATQGYSGGLLTLNEGRRRLGEAAVPDGEKFKPAPVSPFALSARTRSFALEMGDDNLLTTPVQRAEAVMRAGWTKRLGDEADAIAAFMEQFKAVRYYRAAVVNETEVVKIEVSDLAGYDWDWWTRYGAAVIDELTLVVTQALIMDFPDLAVGEVQRIAAAYSRERGAALLQVTGDVNVVAQTRARVGELVAQTIERGDSLKTLEKNLREDFMFSRDRASRVARTETATGLGQGQKQAAQSMGRDEKHWRTQGAADPRVDETCLANEAQGWVEIGSLFVSGHDTVPAHPNCMCKTDYRTRELHEESATPRLTREGRCPQCSKLLLRDVSDATGWCGKCRVAVRFTAGVAKVLTPAV